MSKRRKKKRRIEEEKKNLQISADVTKEGRRGRKPEGGTRKRKGAGIHTHVHQRKKLGNNPLARDQRFHVTRKDHLNPEAPTIRGGFEYSQDHKVEKIGLGIRLHILGASTSGRFRSRSIEKEGRKEERGEGEKGGE